MCGFVRMATDKSFEMLKKSSLFIREMRHGKKEDTAAFDFLSSPKEKKAESGKACSAA